MAANPQQILRERDAEIRNIDAHGEWTPEYKESRKSAVREVYRREYERAREEEKQRIEQRLKSTKADVFRIPTSVTYSDAEAAQVYAAFRGTWADVLSATENPESPGQVGENVDAILEQAERTGDYLLARAAYHRAIDLGAQGIVDKYLSTRPTEAQQWQRYTEAAAEAQQATSFEALLATGMTDRQFTS